VLKLQSVFGLDHIVTQSLGHITELNNVKKSSSIGGAAPL
jgi:hypothetical protein